MEKLLTEELKQKGIKIVANIFCSWKKRLLRNKTGLPRDEMIKQLYRLRDDVITEIQKHKVFSKEKAWSDMTINMIEDLIARWIATGHQVGETNEITQYIPHFMEESERTREGLVFEGDKPKVKTFPFRTMVDLGAIPFVNDYLSKPGFLFFLQDYPWLAAAFDDGEVVPVGMIVNTIGLEALPTLAMFKEELAKRDEHEKWADSGPPQTTGPLLPFWTEGKTPPEKPENN